MTLEQPTPKANYEPDGSCNECGCPTWLDLGNTKTQCGPCYLEAKYGTTVNTLHDAIPAVRRAIKGRYDTRMYGGSDGVFLVATIADKKYGLRKFGRIINLPTSTMTNDDTDDHLEEFITDLFAEAALADEMAKAAKAKKKAEAAEAKEAKA